MGGSGGPNPKGKNIESATVTMVEEGTVRFELADEDAEYFELGKTYRLVAIEK